MSANKTKKAVIIVPLAIILVLALSVSVYFYIQSREYKYLKIQPEINFSSEEEKNLYGYIGKNLTALNQGIRTNRLATPQDGDLPGGRDVLSESLGLLMQYAIEADSKTLFEKQYLFLNEVFIVKGNIVLWKVDENSEVTSTSNALIDDLRICGALIKAYEKWGVEKYLKKALSISKGLKKYNLKNSIPVDFYDYKSKKSGNLLSTRYIDIESMKLLERYDEEWKNITIACEKILKESFKSGEGIYHSEVYNTVDGSYKAEKNVNMINQMVTVENMLKAGLKTDKTLEWLKKSFHWYGFVVGEYEVEGQKPASKNESTAIYSLCARIFEMTGDKETADKFYKRMNDLFRVKDANSVLFGGYAFEKSGESCSFDNLQALLTIRMINGRR